MILSNVSIRKTHRESFGSLGAGNCHRVVIQTTATTAVIDSHGNHVIGIQPDTILFDINYVVANHITRREIASCICWHTTRRTNQFAIQVAFIYIICFRHVQDKSILLVGTLK